MNTNGSMQNISRLVEALLGRHPGGASFSEPYSEYLAAAAPSPDELARQRDTDTRGMPFFGITVFGGKRDAMRRTAASISAQTYTRWIGTNEPLAEKCDFVLYMRAGDTLSPNALYEFAMAAGDHDLIFCDEDRWNGSERTEPRFKWHPALLTQCSFDLLGSGVAASVALHSAAGGMRGGSADEGYAYNLRCLAKSAAPCHLPHVLYTCAEYGLPSSGVRREVERYAGSGGSACSGIWRGSFCVEGAAKKQRVALVISNKNQYEPLMRLLKSVDTNVKSGDAEICIADEGSSDLRTLECYDILERNHAAKVFKAALPLPALLNRAAQSMDRDVTVFLHSSMEALAPTWLVALLKQLSRGHVAAVGPKIVDPAGRLLFTGGVAGIGGWLGSPYAGADDGKDSERKNRLVNSVRNVSALSALCMATPTDRFFSSGGFDESFERIGFDAEYCLRAAFRSQDCVYTPYSVMRCHGTPPAMGEGTDEMRCYDVLRPLLLHGDPNYSPNYDWASAQPTVAVHPEPALLQNARYLKSMGLDR